MAGEPLTLLVVCTGNTCRSVMAAVMLEHLSARRGLGLDVTTGGTHAVEGVPLGARTLSALRTVDELAATLREGTSTAGGHRSRQLTDAALGRADLVVAMEAGHVRYIRRHHPAASATTGMLRTLVRALAPPPAPLADRVGALALGRTPLDPADDVADPAGHDDAAYARCATELWALCRALVTRL